MGSSVVVLVIAAFGVTGDRARAWEVSLDLAMLGDRPVVRE